MRTTQSIGLINKCRNHGICWLTKDAYVLIKVYYYLLAHASRNTHTHTQIYLFIYSAIGIEYVLHSSRNFVHQFPFKWMNRLMMINQFLEEIIIPYVTQYGINNNAEFDYLLNHSNEFIFRAFDISING